MGWLDMSIAVTVPTILGLAAAWPLWRWRQSIVGNAVGAGVLFAAILFLIGVSFVAQQRENQQCVAGLIHCVSRIDAHMPFLIYAFIGIIDACALFWISLIVEERQAPKSWQASESVQGTEH